MVATAPLIMLELDRVRGALLNRISLPTIKEKKYLCVELYMCKQKINNILKKNIFKDTHVVVAYVNCILASIYVLENFACRDLHVHIYKVHMFHLFKAIIPVHV